MCIQTLVFLRQNDEGLTLLPKHFENLCGIVVFSKIKEWYILEKA